MLSTQGFVIVRSLLVGEERRNETLTEVDDSSFSMHSDSTKMYQDLKQNFWWRSMKKNIGKFGNKCMVCYQGSGRQSCYNLQMCRNKNGKIMQLALSKVRLER